MVIETEYERKEAWFLTDANPSGNNALHIIRVGHNTAKMGYKHGPYVKADNSFFFIMQGSLHLYYEDTHIQLQAGDMFCMLKDRRYTYEMAHSELPLQKIWIAFQGDQIHWILKQLNITIQQPYMRNVIKSNAKSILQSILKTMKDHKDPDQMLLIGLFYQLLSAIKPKVKPFHVQNHPNWVDFAKNYMDTHYNEPITVDDVCKHVSVSRGHLSEVFQIWFGVAPSQYMKDLRMDRALQLVRGTSFTITEIAYSVGFHSLFSFSRAFSKHFGYSPNKARMNNDAE